MLLEQNVSIDYDERFSASKMNEYKERFEKLKNQEYISSDSNFDDYIWLVKIRGEELFVEYLNDIELKDASKELGISKEFIDNSVKVYMLNIIETRGLSTTYKTLLILKKLMKRNLVIEGSYISTNMLKICRKFNDFIGDIFAEYIEYVEEYTTDILYQTRKLTSFSSIFKFTDLINRFYNENIKNREVLLRWYPIIIWWKLSTVIPIRPSELINMERNCIEKVDGNYYITVKRGKGKTSGFEFGNTSDEKECYYNDRITITKELYMFFKRYFKYIKQFEGDLIFSKELYILLNHQNPNLNVNKFTAKNLDYLLRCFYENIIKKHYGYNVFNRDEKNYENLKENDIERIVLYDARHIAIVNAIFLGYDIHVVQRLARHEDINTTYGYYKHQYEYATSFALAFSKKLAHKNDLKNVPIIKKTNNKSKGKLLTNTVMKAYTTNDKTERKDFEDYGGYCEYFTNTDISFCIRFLPNHSLCPHFVPYNEDDGIHDAEKKLYNCIKVLCDIVENRDKIPNFKEKISIQKDSMRDNTYALAQLMSKKEK